ncbi:MAG: hypothetical protein K2L97_04715, partial [Muribaculaceae bacterium]|nr:hypothetical protein [Muribaculaceae bacterium]
VKRKEPGAIPNSFYYWIIFNLVQLFWVTSKNRRSLFFVTCCKTLKQRGCAVNLNYDTASGKRERREILKESFRGVVEI